jgi:hypothetical protein
MKPDMDGQDRKPDVDRRGDGEKLVVDGVVTHARLVQMIKQRNPIIARRDDRSGRAQRS